MIHGTETNKLTTTYGVSMSNQKGRERYPAINIRSRCCSRRSIVFLLFTLIPENAE